MARKTVTQEDCQAAVDKLKTACEVDDLMPFVDDNKYRLMTVVDGMPKPIYEKSLAPSSFVQCCNFTADFLEFLGEGDDSD